jgi:hypothetical protein
MSDAQVKGLEALGCAIFFVGLFAFNLRTGTAFLKLFVTADRGQNPRGFWLIQAIVIVLALVWLVRSVLTFLGRIAP